jgi:DNA-binding PadR family transcriptional regulator
MEERLKNLKKSMQNASFNRLAFTDELRKEIQSKVSKQTESDEDILLAVLQLLVHKKTGYELAKNLRRRGIQKFEDNEGYLYTLLHYLEQKGVLYSVWTNSDSKFYYLNDTGKKILKKAEKKQGKNLFTFKELLGGSYSE